MRAREQLHPIVLNTGHLHFVKRDINQGGYNPLIFFVRKSSGKGEVLGSIQNSHLQLGESGPICSMAGSLPAIFHITEHY